MSFTNKDGLFIALKMIEVIQQNKVWLSEIDGAAGDGDHGINMSKGFTLAKNKISQEMPMSEAFLVISHVLMDEIGGSMGPLYGIWFRGLSRESAGHGVIDEAMLQKMFSAALSDLRTFTSAEPGDKTLLDTLVPATQALADGKGLNAMKQAAEEGFNATRKMIPRVGRASRVGERSVGHPDAGAASCLLLLTAFIDEAQWLSNKEIENAKVN